MSFSVIETSFMQLALDLAVQGQGHVEPNPMVGCVIVKENQIIGQGYHQKYGGPHAEVEALRSCTYDPTGATVYVTLEPCSHTGKTPPCAQALIKAQVKHVVIAAKDPFPEVSGRGIEILNQAGITVDVGLLEGEAQQLNAPYLKLIHEKIPWIIAKWAMTLDGKIATSSGSSKWITNSHSRSFVHQLRGKVDAILIGSNTAKLDNPLLTARPTGPKTAVRVVVDSQASLALDSNLVQTAKEIPVLIAVSKSATQRKCEQLQEAGCEVFLCPQETHQQRMKHLLKELGNRRMTNLLVEGGGQVLGLLQDLNQIDEVYTFISPKIVGGSGASPVQGSGVLQMADAWRLENIHVESFEDDTLIQGRIKK